MLIKFSTLLVITFFCELALVFIGFSLKDRMFQILQEEMISSINSTKPGIMKTWNVIQREVNLKSYKKHVYWYMSC